MQNSRDRWTFIQHPSKPQITPEEVRYWKKSLSSILKVGLEFEFNLPDKVGSCKGDSNACPCHNMQISFCWKQCTKQEACGVIKDLETCSNKDVQGKGCDAKLCPKCADFKFNCIGLKCADFESACFSCGLFEVKCDGCKHKYDPKGNPQAIRDKITVDLKPNNTYGTINASGVHSVTTDGSLLGGDGMEVITIGRRLDYWEFYKMSKRIIDKAMANGAYVNERCSIHMHVLASYFGKLFSGQELESIPNHINELERPMPQIILANLHQLCRRYQNAMTWMSLGLDDPKKMTRWEKFRVSILDISPILDTMNQVRERIKSAAGGGRKAKYGFLNYNYVYFDEKSDVSRFHVEYRVMDCLLSPSAVAAFACLFYALVIKAVEISKYGVLEVGDKAWMDKACKVKDTILNNMKEWNNEDRFGHTENVMQHRDYLVRESLELIHQLKHILVKIGPAYPILESLADTPVALRRIEGQNWEQIENNLAVQMAKEDVMAQHFDEYIDLRIISKCKDLKEWITEVSKAIHKENEALGSEHQITEKLTDYVEEGSMDGDLIWSSIGAVVKL